MEIKTQELGLKREPGSDDPRRTCGCGMQLMNASVEMALPQSPEITLRHWQICLPNPSQPFQLNAGFVLYGNAIH